MRRFSASPIENEFDLEFWNVKIEISKKSIFVFDFALNNSFRFHSFFFVQYNTVLLFHFFKKQKRMADWLGSVNDIVSLVADSKAILGFGAGGLALFSVAGVTPRVGLMRSLSLGFKSYFKTTYPLSVRKSEIKQLRDSILCMGKGDYIIVTGGKGIGKTCLIDTTLIHHFGVVKISVSCLSYYIVMYVAI